MNLSLNKILAYIGWFALFVATVNLAMRDDLFQDDLEGMVIATVKDHSGRVQMRTENVALWSYVGSDQELVNGSIVATGKNSYASILFLTGRMIEIAPNSQVVVIHQDDNSDDFGIVLLKGKFRSKRNKDANDSLEDSKLTITIDDTEIISDQITDNIAFQKNIDGKKPTVEVKRGQIKLKKGRVGLFDGNSGKMKDVFSKKGKKSNDLAAPKAKGFTGKLDEMDEKLEVSDRKKVEKVTPVFADIAAPLVVAKKSKPRKSKNSLSAKAFKSSIADQRDSEGDKNDPFGMVASAGENAKREGVIEMAEISYLLTV